jgi:hypothetical protein
MPLYRTVGDGEHRGDLGQRQVGQIEQGHDLTLALWEAADRRLNVEAFGGRRPRHPT